MYRDYSSPSKYQRNELSALFHFSNVYIWCQERHLFHFVMRVSICELFLKHSLIFSSKSSPKSSFCRYLTGAMIPRNMFCPEIRSSVRSVENHQARDDVRTRFQRAWSRPCVDRNAQLMRSI